MATNSGIRIPNLPIGPIVDKDGNPTDNELIFRQALIDLLQKNFGPEGIVSPAQSPANVQVINNNLDAINNVYTMAPGTFIYQQDGADYTQDKMIISFRDSNTTGAQTKLYYINVTAL